MSTRNNRSAKQRKQLWIGTVEVRPQHEGNEILGGMRGAFVNIVTWAADAEGYRHNAERVIEGVGGLFVAEVLNSEPVDTRRARLGGHFEESIEDLVSRAETNPNAILYGTFHLFEKDDA